MFSAFIGILDIQFMKENQINNLDHLKDRRRELRRNLTPAEARLWTILKGKGLEGRKFRRQHSVENYILDFYCPEEKLAVELDGAVHNDPIQAFHDEVRDNRLRAFGIKVLRFENRLVFERPDMLLDEIVRHFSVR
jgi:very-short-patch-repair endonuclease